MLFFPSYRNLKVSAAMLLAILLASTSCVELQDDAPQATGFLAPMSVSFDVSVEDMVESKALPLPEIEAPSTSEITFTVKDKNGNVKYSGKGPWTNDILVPVGKYTVEAVYGTNGFGEPGFVGSASGTVDPYEKEKVNLTLQLSNSLVAVSLSSDFADHFTPDSKVTLTCSGESHVADFGRFCFVPSGSSVSLELTGKNSAGKQTVFEYEFTSPAPRTAYEVVCGKKTADWPSISLSDDGIEAWASRIYITKPASFGGKISDTNQSALVYEAVPSGSAESSPVTAVVENGVPVIKGLTPGQEYQVRARVGALVSNVVNVTPVVDGFSATAAHTFTGGELDGTDVTSTFSKPDIVKNAISSWTINLCKSDGTVLRSGLSLGTSDGSAITSATGWPYLPVGNGEKYVIKVSASMDGKTYDFADYSLSVPATPDFSLAMSAYTSYDKYAATNGITKSVDAANGCDPSTLYNAGAKWGISTNLMKNSNYAKTLVINIDGNTDRTYAVTDYQYNEYYENITGLGWSAHSLTVSLTFDKKTVSKTQTHHITGLPYSAAPPKIEGAHAWSFAGGTSESWGGNDEYARLGNGAMGTSTITSPDFHIPSDINVNIISNYYVKCDNPFGGKNVFTFKLGSIELKNTTVNGSGNTSDQVNSDISMTASNNYIVCSNSYGFGTSHSKIYSVIVKYR